MTNFNPLDSLGFQCNLTFKVFAKALQERLTGTGVSRVQFMALAHLVAFGKMPQKDLADWLSITSASTVRLVDRLSRDGWVERISDPNDRRVNLISPTKKAVKAWDEISDHALEITSRAYAGLTKNEIDNAKTILKKVRENLKKNSINPRESLN